MRINWLPKSSYWKTRLQIILLVNKILRMNSIVVKPINSQFVVVWIKLMIRKGHKIEDFNFDQIQSKSGPCVTITNPHVLESLTKDFQNFRLSKLSMEEFFQCNIIIAKRLHCEKFFIAKRGRLTYQQVFLFSLIFDWFKFSPLLSFEKEQTFFTSKKKVNCSLQNQLKGQQLRSRQFSIFRQSMSINSKNTKKKIRFDSTFSS